MLKGSRKYWFIALLFGLAAGLAFYRYLQDVKELYRPDNLIQVVRAREAISKDSVINEEQVEIATLPAKYVHPDALVKENAVIGKIATSNISPGEEILKGRLLSAQDSEHRLAYTIPVSKRAVSIPIDNINGVSGFIEVGDRVDIIGTIDIPLPTTQGHETMRTYSILTLQDIEVLAVGENPDLAVNQKNPVGAKTITLSVSLQEAQPLVLASERGKLRLLLRHPVDKSRAVLTPFQLQDFLAQSPVSGNP
ncbi:MAG: Flp pilus assembly protein CpaB [Syntrophomonadaceae bacterium]|nr:Flp pilus assembly protein CpaB [Syntrophomonadaceae bacterium]